MGGVFVKNLNKRWAVIGAAWVLAAVGCQSSGTNSAVLAGEPTPTAQKQMEPRASEPRAETASPDFEPVYFDLDAWTLDARAQQTLRATARQILDHPDWGKVKIEGHCDERGSEEYNLALGKRRAASVKRYLEDLGVSSKRFEVVSYGESKPAVVGHDESAWRFNRRSAMRPTAQNITQR
jgi:peptidoglycan-associated lipoprotein